MIELWDVLSLTTHGLLHAYSGQNHAWLALAIIVAVSALDRDLLIHEIVSAIFMLRFACNTVMLDGVVAYVPCLLVAASSAFAHVEGYLTMPHTVRRATLFANVVLAVMIRYSWNTTAFVSTLRLLIYTALTRRSVTCMKQDSWDAAVQCMAILCIPEWMLVLPLLLPAGSSLMEWYKSTQAKKQRSIRVREGIIEEV